MKKEVLVSNKGPKAVKVGAWERMLVNPAESEMTRTPSTEPYRASITRFQRSIVFRPTTPGQAFAFNLRPDISNTLHVMSANGLALQGQIGGAAPNPQSYFVSVQLNTREKGTINGQGAYQIRNAYFQPGRDDSLPSYPITIGIRDDDVTFVPVTFTTGLANGALTVVTDALRPITVWAQVAGALVAIGVASQGVPLVFQPGANVPIGPFYYSQLGAMPKSSIIGVMMYSNNTSLWESNGAHYDLFSTQAADLVNQNVSTYKVCAMSMLAKFTGSALEYGGDIAAARGRPGYNPGLRANVFTALSQLPTDRYVGALREGAYVWWLPSDLSELNQRQPNELNSDETTLWIAGSFDTEDASLQLTFDLVVEFYSDRQIFSSSLGPPLVDEYARAYHALATVPAATCNPDHKELFKSLVSGGKKAVKGAAGAILSNPDLAMALLATLL